jgi:multidrug transporter EmrE-like cation transporter
MLKLYTLFWFLVAAITAALPIPFIKTYTKTKNIGWIILSVISYLILIYAYSIVLTDRNISIVYPILKVLSIIIVVFTGLIFFYNKLDMKSWFGIFLGTLSIYLLSSKIT